LWRKDGFGEGRLGKENKEEGGHEVPPQTYRNVIPYKGAVDVGEGAAMQRTQTRDTQNSIWSAARIWEKIFKCSFVEQLAHAKKKKFANWQSGAGGEGGGRGLPAEGVQALDRVGHLLPLGAFNQSQEVLGVPRW